MRILWFTWRDLKNPFAGGAERINEEIAKRLVKNGHQVTLLVGGFEGCVPEEIRDGYRIIRVGNRYTVYWHAYRYYKRRLKEWADIVIDEMNTIPFFCKFYVRERNILFTYQLCREIWFYEMSLPFSVIGYLLEPIYLRLLNDRKVITESDSTKKDLLRYGFASHRVNIISVGIPLEPAEDISSIEKFALPTLLSLGSIRSMKRTEDQIKAFEIAKRTFPELQLKIAGNATGTYGEKILSLMKRSPYADDIEYMGAVSEDKKTELMRKCHAIMVTSVKEGWGLIVTEANSQGTPAIVYNVDGLRDSVRHEQTGIICRENNPQGLADAAVNILSDQPNYDRLRMNAWRWSREFTFDRCYEDFMRGIVTK